MMNTKKREFGLIIIFLFLAISIQNEHILSANLNYQHDFAFGDFTPRLKLGGYTECRKDNVSPVIGSV